MNSERMKIYIHDSRNPFQDTFHRLGIQMSIGTSVAFHNFCRF